ncbi:MAG: TlpA family protein disulfide reductase [Anaerolineae bacterium]|nr:TlpA family protein disulfide reductase [Anaerolineae bacterium]
MMRAFLLIVVLLCAACASTETAPGAGTAVTPYPAPDFTLETLNGGTFSLASMRGRWVILNFWATWCAPCTDEMPALQTIASERAGQLALFGINMRESADDIRTYMTRYRVSFPMLLNPDEAMSANYRLELGIPQTVIITPEGEIVWHKFGAIDLDSFRSTLDELMTGSG